MSVYIICLMLYLTSFNQETRFDPNMPICHMALNVNIHTVPLSITKASLSEKVNL